EPRWSRNCRGQRAARLQGGPADNPSEHIARRLDIGQRDQVRRRVTGHAQIVPRRPATWRNAYPAATAPGDAANRAPEPATQWSADALDPVGFAPVGPLLVGLAPIAQRGRRAAVRCRAAR